MKSEIVNRDTYERTSEEDEINKCVSNLREEREDLDRRIAAIQNLCSHKISLDSVGPTGKPNWLGIEHCEYYTCVICGRVVKQYDYRAEIRP